MTSSLSCVPVSTLASSHRGKTAARRSQGRIWRNLILVLEATLNSPVSWLLAPGLETTEASALPNLMSMLDIVDLQALEDATMEIPPHKLD